MTERSTAAAGEVDRINTFFPLLPRLGNRWAASRPWEGLTIGLNLHLTTLTAALLRELALGGGEWVVSASNPATTDRAVVDLLREQGIEVHTAGALDDRHLAVLDRRPEILADVGFELLATLLDRRAAHAAALRGAVEVTRTGITRMRRRPELPFGVLNLNAGRLKPHIENRHGAGEALLLAVREITGLHLSGRRVLVVGYGPVGQGLAAYARAAGAAVAVVERDPVRRLRAHYDGFPTPALAEGLGATELVVTATGSPRAIPIEALWAVRSELVLVNAGHGGDEIDIDGLRAEAEAAEQIGELCTRYRLPGGPWLAVLGGGHPLNIVTNSGSPEPVLIHFAVLGLALEWLAVSPLPPGEQAVPPEVEERAAALALEALGAV